MGHAEPGRDRWEGPALLTQAEYGAATGQIRSSALDHEGPRLLAFSLAGPSTNLLASLSSPGPSRESTGLHEVERLSPLRL